MHVRPKFRQRKPQLGQIRHMKPLLAQKSLQLEAFGAHVLADRAVACTEKTAETSFWAGEAHGTPVLAKSAPAWTDGTHGFPALEDKAHV